MRSIWKWLIILRISMISTMISGNPPVTPVYYNTTLIKHNVYKMLPVTLELFQQQQHKILYKLTTTTKTTMMMMTLCIDEFTVINSHFCSVRNKTFAIKSSSQRIEKNFCEERNEKPHREEKLCVLFSVCSVWFWRILFVYCTTIQSPTSRYIT